MAVPLSLLLGALLATAAPETKQTTTAPPATSTAPTIIPLSDADDTPGVRATFEVDAPADVVLDLLWDVSRFKRIFPDIKELTVLDQAPTRVDVRFEVDAVVAKPTYTLRRSLDVGRGEISWFNIAGDLKRVVGRWVVRPANDARRSIVVYESFVDIGIVGVSTVYRDIVKGKLDQMATRVRTAADLAAHH
jgi:ribosome-associated toxin RatA of RatAB toxin-antitoxin module